MSEHQKEKFAGSYLELFVASASMFLLFAVMLTWLIFTSPYGLFDDHERLKTVNFIFIVHFSLGPMIAVLAGIAFDTFPLVYNIPSFERTNYASFLATQYTRSTVYFCRCILNELGFIDRIIGNRNYSTFPLSPLVGQPCDRGF